MRRLSAETEPSYPSSYSSFNHPPTSHPGDSDKTNNGIDGVYTPPQMNRIASPMMRPPPLEPLSLRGFRDDTPDDARLLTTAIAEEIRIMVPARLSLVDEWALIYSLDQDGASLATLYEKCAEYEGRRVGFVLVVKDCEGGVRRLFGGPLPVVILKKLTTANLDLWGVSIRLPTSGTQVLRHGRVFPLASIRHGIAASASVGRHYTPHAHYDHRVADLADLPYRLGPVESSAAHVAVHPLQGIPI
jgi:hypothetical protein